MSSSVVAIFCGPHENGVVSFRRIDVAIQVALRIQVPLVIAGDGNFGRDLDVFAKRAHLAGVTIVKTFYDARANTLADAQMVCEHLSTSAEFYDVRTIHLVTDFWHMPRATLILISQMTTRLFELVCVPVMTPVPSLDVLLAEQRGIQDLFSGQYGIRHNGVHFGKPAHPDSVTFSYTQSLTS